MLFLELTITNIPSAVIFCLAIIYLKGEKSRADKLLLTGFFLILVTGLAGVLTLDYILKYHSELTLEKYFPIIITFLFHSMNSIGLWLCLRAYIKKSKDE